MDRRSYLIAAGMLTMAGCTSSNDSKENDSPNSSSEPTDTTQTNETPQESEEDGNTSVDDEDTDGESDDDADDEQDGDSEPEPEPEPSFDVSLESPDSVTHGDEFTVTATISNIGDAAGEFQSGVSIRNQGSSWEETDQSVGVSLDPGESFAIDLTFTDGYGTGQLDVRIDTADVSTTVDIQAPAELEYTVEAPDSVQFDADIEMAVTIKNVGGTAGNANLTVERRDDGEWEEHDSMFRTIGPGETFVWEFEGYVPINKKFVSYRIQDIKTWTVEAFYTSSYVRDHASSPTYDELFRNFESYKGGPLHFSAARIIDAHYDYTEDNRDLFRIEVSNSSNDSGDIFALYRGDDRLIEDDIIELWGVARKLTTYETVMGSDRTIPSIDLVDFEIIDS